MGKFNDAKWRRSLNEQVVSDLRLPVDKQMILQADNPDMERGLKVCYKSTGGYHVVYWHGSPDNEVAAELRAAPELPEDDKWQNHGEGFGDHKHVWLGYHPSIDENILNEDGHIDLPSAKRKLKLSIEDSQELLQQLESMDEESALPSWWMDKLTLASDYLNKARNYLLNRE